MPKPARSASISTPPTLDANKAWTKLLEAAPTVAAPCADITYEGNVSGNTQATPRALGAHSNTRTSTGLPRSYGTRNVQPGGAVPRPAATQPRAPELASVAATVAEATSEVAEATVAPFGLALGTAARTGSS